MTKKYWLVHGRGPTNHRHLTHEDALREAKRLATECPGEVVVVLEAVEAVRHAPPPPPPLQVVSFDRDDEIPF